MNMRKIFTLITALFFALSASTQFVQIDRLNTVTVNQIPRYASLINATAAGSRPGNLVLIHSGADTGVWVRSFDNTNWIRVNAVQSTTNVTNQLGANNLKTTSFFKPVDTLPYPSIYVDYLLGSKYVLPINAGPESYFTGEALPFLFSKSKTNRGYLSVNFNGLNSFSSWYYTLDYITEESVGNVVGQHLSEAIPDADIYKVGNGLLYPYKIPEWIGEEQIDVYYFKYIMFYVNNSGGLASRASYPIRREQHTKFSDTYLCADANNNVSWFIYQGDSATTGFVRSGTTINTNSTRDVFQRTDIQSIGSPYNSNHISELSNTYVVDLQKRFYSGALSTFFLGYRNFVPITALVSGQPTGKSHVCFNKRFVSAPDADTAYWQDGLFNYNAQGILNIKFVVLDTSIYMLGCYNNGNNAVEDDSTVVYRCNFSSINTGNPPVSVTSPSFTKIGVFPFHVLEVTPLDLKEGSNATIAHLRVGSGTPQNPIVYAPESYITTNFFDAVKIPKDRVPYRFGWVDPYLNTIIGWNDNIGVLSIKYGEVEYRY